MCPSVLVLITHIAGRHAQSVNTASAANTLAIIFSPTGLPVKPLARSAEAGRLRDAVATSARWSCLPLQKAIAGIMQWISCPISRKSWQATTAVEGTGGAV